MMSKTATLTASVIGAALLLAGCGQGDQDANAGLQAESEGALADVDVQVPTQEEADAEAAAEITAENADDVFGQLSEEIESDLEAEK